MSEPSFYLVLNKETKGPFPASQVGAMLTSQQISESTLAMRVGDSEQKWRPLFNYFDGYGSNASQGVTGAPSQPAGALPQTGGSGSGEAPNRDGGYNDGKTLVLPVVPGANDAPAKAGVPAGLPSAKRPMQQQAGVSPTTSSVPPIPRVQAISSSMHHAPVAAWEYRVVEQPCQSGQVAPQDLHAKCNQLGSEGWELGGVLGTGAQAVLIFKRPR